MVLRSTLARVALGWIRVRNLDIIWGPGIHIVGPAEAIPLPDNSVDLVISQETLEHVADPVKAIAEITRV